MSSVFGKPRAGGERPPQSPLGECNVAILGCRGAGKSGEAGAPMPRGWAGIRVVLGCRCRGGGTPASPASFTSCSSDREVSNQEVHK